MGRSEEAALAGLNGAVQISAIVGEDGTVRALHVARSLGLGLDEKAMEAVKSWRFKPGMKDEIFSVAIKMKRAADPGLYWWDIPVLSFAVSRVAFRIDNESRSSVRSDARGITIWKFC